MSRAQTRNQRSDPRRLARSGGQLQGPPIQTLRNQLNISPIVQTIRDRQAARQGFYEEVGDILLNGRPGLFPGMTSIYQNAVRRPVGQPQRLGITHPAASATQTLRQLEAYNRLKAAAELETDRMERNLAVNEMWAQLIYNEWVLSQVARNCVPHLPPSSSFEAVIISMATARRIFGPGFGSTLVVRNAPRVSLAPAAAAALQRLRRYAGFGGRPVPEAVMIRRFQLPSVFDYFARNPAPAPRRR